MSILHEFDDKVRYPLSKWKEVNRPNDASIPSDSSVPNSRISSSSIPDPRLSGSPIPNPRVLKPRA